MKTILVVEDEEYLREPVALALDSLGYRVLQATNGQDGYALVVRECVDVVISDLRMPGGDGLELLARIKSLPGPAPAVALATGFLGLSAEEAYALGAEAILVKPFELDEVEATVERLLTSKSER